MSQHIPTDKVAVSFHLPTDQHELAAIEQVQESQINRILQNHRPILTTKPKTSKNNKGHWEEHCKQKHQNRSQRT